MVVVGREGSGANAMQVYIYAGQEFQPRVNSELKRIKPKRSEERKGEEAQQHCRSEMYRILYMPFPCRLFHFPSLLSLCYWVTFSTKGTLSVQCVWALHCQCWVTQCVCVSGVDPCSSSLPFRCLRMCVWDNPLNTRSGYSTKHSSTRIYSDCACLHPA